MLYLKILVFYLLAFVLMTRADLWQEHIGYSGVWFMLILIASTLTVGGTVLAIADIVQNEPIFNKEQT